MLISFDSLNPLLFVIWWMNFTWLTIIIANQCSRNSPHKKTSNHKPKFSLHKQDKSLSLDDTSANPLNPGNSSTKNCSPTVDKRAKKNSKKSQKYIIKRKSSHSLPSFPSPPEPRFLMQQSCSYDDSDSFRSYTGENIEVLNKLPSAQSKLEELLNSLECSKDAGSKHAKDVDPSLLKTSTPVLELDMKANNEIQINGREKEKQINSPKFGNQPNPPVLIHTLVNPTNNLVILPYPEMPPPVENPPSKILPEKCMPSLKISKNTMSKLEKLIKSIENSCRDQIPIESKAPGNKPDGEKEKDQQDRKVPSPCEVAPLKTYNIPSCEFHG